MRLLPLPSLPAEPSQQLERPLEWRWAVANDRTSTEAAQREAMHCLEGQGLSPRTLLRVELVIEEMLMNRLMHAFPDGGEHLTQLWVSLGTDDVRLVFEDDGVPFDPLQAQAPAVPSHLSQAPVGGLGLVLTRKSARSCHYERVDGHNRFAVSLARA